MSYARYRIIDTIVDKHIDLLYDQLHSLYTFQDYNRSGKARVSTLSFATEQQLRDFLAQG